MAGGGGPDPVDAPLGDGLQKEYLPLFRIVPEYHQVGCVNLKWKANAAGGHHGERSRGVYSTKWRFISQKMPRNVLSIDSNTVLCAMAYSTRPQ